MLWRFLLVAVAVSCTLSRTHANGPRDRIKDLLCVLLFSGIQKEDLDVSMLNKLQRYNVNIQDTNNEDLLQECMTLRNKNNKDINTTATDINVVPGKVLNENKKFLQSNPAQPHKESSIQTVNTKEINNDRIQYIDGKPKLDSVLKFWEDMRLKKDTTLKNNKDLKYVTEGKNKRNVRDNLDSNEEDDIRKLIENYFSKRHHNKNIRGYIKDTTTSSIDNIYKQTERPDNVNDFDIIRNIPNILPLNVNNYNSHIRTVPILDTESIYGNYTDILGVFNRYNTRNEYLKQHKENSKLSYNPYLRNFMKTEVVATTEREIHQKISNDMIKEIANSVKEIVLRDLKLNIQDTNTIRTSVTPTTNRITKATQPSTIDNNIKIQESVLNKFLEMFEEFKSLKKNSILISSNNVNKQNVQQVLPRALTLETMNEMKSPNPYSPYRAQYPRPSENLQFSPQEHKFRSSEARVTVRTAFKSLIPITLQTNNLEIPPLGIPIDKPSNPINQNIIVTSEMPYRIGVIKNNLGPRNNPFEDLNKFTKHYPKQSHMSKSRDDFNVPSYDVRFTSNKNVHKHQANYYDKIHSNNHRPRSDNLEYIKEPEVPRFHERLENIDFLDVPDKKRYTDRVDCCNEKYAYSKQMVECCNRKIASRQQMSLNNMKKGSYDDTHFKNFLKTQQKVTDMLERILATRDTVRSVETT